MTILLYTLISSFRQYRFNQYLSQMPGNMQQKINGFRQQHDRYASLLGKLLLQEGLQLLGIKQVDLADLKYTAFNRPYLDIPVDFNISHSGDLVVCLLSNQQRVGVDVEKITPVAVDDFREQFTETEWHKIKNGADSCISFYDCWTRKEALIKANGKGLSIPLNRVSIENDTTELENEKWFLRKICLPGDHITAIATSKNTADLSIVNRMF